MFGVPSQSRASTLFESFHRSLRLAQNIRICVYSVEEDGGEKADGEEFRFCFHRKFAMGYAGLALFVPADEESRC